MKGIGSIKLDWDSPEPSPAPSNVSTIEKLPSTSDLPEKSITFSNIQMSKSAVKSISMDLFRITTDELNTHRTLPLGLSEIIEKP